MIELRVVLTNEEVEALAPELERTESTLAKRMSTGEMSPRDPTTLAYAAHRKVFRPLRDHLNKLGAR